MKKIISNSFWLVFDKIFKILVGLFVGVWIARYFGPEIFGKFNYANSIVVLFGAILPLGTEGILVRDLVENREQNNSLLSISFYIHLITGILFFIFSILLINFLKSDDSLTIQIGFILSISLLFRFLAVPRFFFEARTEIKYIVFIENSLFVIFTVVRVVLLVYQFPILFFVFSFLIESIASFLCIFLFYCKFHSFLIFQLPRFELSVKLIKDSFPIFVSALSVILYMKVDQLMIGSIVGDSAVGVYSVAVRLSEFWYFLPLGISSSFYPTLINQKRESEEKYRESFQNLHIILFFISILMAIFVQIFADKIVMLLYGNQYIQAAGILRVYIWSGIFVFMGVAGSNYYLIENKQKFVLLKSVVGLVVNIVLNFFWIPIYGPIGAAMATLISQFCASTLIPFASKDVRDLLFFQINCLAIWNWKSPFYIVLAKLRIK